METTATVNSLEFFAEPFNIAPENKITVYRYNDDFTTPFHHVNRTLWNYDAKAVRALTPLGVYGFSGEQVRLGRCNYFFNAFSDSVQLKSPIRILQLEVDKNKVFYSDDMEFVFTEANIIGVLTWDELKKLFPAYTEVIDTYNEVLATNYSQDSTRAKFYQAVDVTRRLCNAIPAIGGETTEIHGITHGIRVERNGYMLCQLMGVDGRIVRPFAYSHDFCRLNDGTDPGHGLRAANHIELHREFYKYHFGISDTEVDLLKYACQHHTDLLKSDYEIVNICFDADRLDLTRVGTVPDPNYMATTLGGIYAATLQR
ncbi:MAG TPA: hypothetical protein PLH91_12785 [Tenuifilaceae bacterium]|nr:hypothetical protein [Tenuifilaceae bacterium]HPI46104.1 hypothetical protein [Tenuifilaceae bacterium]HPN23062.1 hypothetical protein [Tenuifilaceae bacterium]